MSHRSESIHTRIWEEIPESDNPFAAALCRCSGYDVYGDLLGKISWIEYLFLLFRQEPPSHAQAELLQTLAVALANPGPRDPSVHAAMSAGVGGSTHASCLMAALAVGAGQLGGAREVAIAMEYWQDCGQNLEAWRNRLENPPKEERADVWQPLEHPAGFDPNGARCPTPVKQSLDLLAHCSPGESLCWLKSFRSHLESIAHCPLAMTGVAAAAFTDLGFSAPQGEMLFLFLRLPGAAAHALEQAEQGWRRFPFFADGIKLED